MNLVKLGKKGRVTIPKAVRDALAVEGETWWTVAATADGAIVMRPAYADLIELYDDALEGRAGPRRGGLEGAYAAAIDEWTASDDAVAWDALATDGLEG
jgi:AbrB family looped-hinge helix DNA binding protein